MLDLSKYENAKTMAHRTEVAEKYQKIQAFENVYNDIVATAETGLNKTAVQINRQHYAFIMENLKALGYTIQPSQVTDKLPTLYIFW